MPPPDPLPAARGRRARAADAAADRVGEVMAGSPPGGGGAGSSRGGGGGWVPARPPEADGAPPAASGVAPGPPAPPWLAGASPPSTGPALRWRLPDTLAGGRLALVPRAVVGLAVVAVLAALLGAGFWWASRAGEPVVVAPRTSGGSRPTGAAPDVRGSAASPAAAPAAARAGAVSAAPVVVHVTGRVQRPGVVRLPAGARVADALAAAGGPTGRADLAAINLARLLVDGEQVLVLGEGETPPATAPSAPGGAGAAATGSGGPAPGPVPLDLNTATQEQLEALPGVGPVLARRILDVRAEQGRFRSVEELQDVSGVGPSTYAELAPLVRV